MGDKYLSLVFRRFYITLQAMAATSFDVDISYRDIAYTDRSDQGRARRAQGSNNGGSLVFESR